MALTPKQQVFVAEYLVDLNATKAAIRAGYVEKSAHVHASRMLRNAKVSDAIAEAMSARSQRTEITIDRVLKEYARLAFLDIRKAFDKDGNLLPIHDIDDDTAAAIAGLEVESLLGSIDVEVELETQTQGGALKRSRAKKVIGRLHKIKLADKKGALDSIAKHLGMFIERTEISTKNGEPLIVMTLGVSASIKDI
jgi:phage terminase small subunit